MVQFMKLGHMLVLRAKIGLKWAILTKNNSKMAIFDPFKKPQLQGTKNLTLKNLLKKSLVLGPLG